MSSSDPRLKRVAIAAGIASVIFGIFVALGGLNTPDADATNKELLSKLPANCTFTYLGKYTYDKYNSLPVAFVQCDNQLTTTTVSATDCNGGTQCSTMNITTNDTSRLNQAALKQLKQSIALEERLKMDAQLKVYGKITD